MSYGQYFLIQYIWRFHIRRCKPNKYTRGPIIISKHSSTPKRCNKSGAKFVIDLMEVPKMGKYHLQNSNDWFKIFCHDCYIVVYTTKQIFISQKILSKMIIYLISKSYWFCLMENSSAFSILSSTKSIVLHDYLLQSQIKRFVVFYQILPDKWSSFSRNKEQNHF